MNAKSLKLVAFAAALAITAGCAKKPPEQLPPAPGTETPTTTTGDETGNVGTTVVP